MPIGGEAYPKTRTKYNKFLAMFTAVSVISHTNRPRIIQYVSQ